MGQKYAKRFAGKEAEILRDIKVHGFMGAMMKWDARDYVSWSKFIASLKGKPLDVVETGDVKERALIVPDHGNLLGQTPLRGLLGCWMVEKA